MAVPKRRHSSTRRDKRRANDGLTPANLDSCPKCGETKRPHRVCSECGTYRGREVIQPDEIEE